MIQCTTDKLLKSYKSLHMDFSDYTPKKAFQRGIKLKVPYTFITLLWVSTKTAINSPGIFLILIADGSSFYCNSTFHTSGLFGCTK